MGPLIQEYRQRHWCEQYVAGGISDPAAVMNPKAAKRVVAAESRYTVSNSLMYAG